MTRGGWWFVGDGPCVVTCFVSGAGASLRYRHPLLSFVTRIVYSFDIPYNLSLQDCSFPSALVLVHPDGKISTFQLKGQREGTRRTGPEVCGLHRLTPPRDLGSYPYLPLRVVCGDGKGGGSVDRRGSGSVSFDVLLSFKSLLSSKLQCDWTRIIQDATWTGCFSLVFSRLLLVLSKITKEELVLCPHFRCLLKFPVFSVFTTTTNI